MVCAMARWVNIKRQIVERLARTDNFMVFEGLLNRDCCRQQIFTPVKVHGRQAKAAFLRLLTVTEAVTKRYISLCN
jgi:hypothetical protein